MNYTKLDQTDLIQGIILPTSTYRSIDEPRKALERLNQVFQGFKLRGGLPKNSPVLRHLSNKEQTKRTQQLDDLLQRFRTK